MKQSQITILGSGTCVPSLKRNPCSFLMQTDGQKLLFDCGPGVMRRLLEIGVSIFDITHIFVSHFHPDHIGELASFLFALKYATPPPTRQQPLTIIAGEGFKVFFKRLNAVYSDFIDMPPGRLTVIELNTTGADQHRHASFRVASLPVTHRPESLAFRIVDKSDKVLVYSGDTDVCDTLVAIADHADLMICESAMPDDLKVAGHLTPSQAGSIAQAAGVKRLVLTHFYPPCDNAHVEKQCRNTYSGEVILAADFMNLWL